MASVFAPVLLVSSSSVYSSAKALTWSPGAGGWMLPGRIPPHCNPRSHAHFAALLTHLHHGRPAPRPSRADASLAHVHAPQPLGRTRPRAGRKRKNDDAG